MDFELECVSPMGARFAELADKHAAEFSASAERHDLENSFPFPSWDEMRRSGFLSATVPQELGGLGVVAVTEIVTAISRLARGDGSTALGAAMHCTAFWYLSRLASGAAVTGGSQPQRDRIRMLLRACARGRVIACVALSEPGASLGHPKATATLAGDGTYLIDGRKSFCTNSPAGSLFLSTVRVRSAGQADQLGLAAVPRETPGLTVLDNWDALGMRGSGSGDVLFDHCPLPAGMLTVAGPIGVLPPGMFPLTMAGVLVLAGAFLGIAERAHELITGSITRRSAGQGTAAPSARGAVQAVIGENEIDLASSRAILWRTSVLLDRQLGQAPEDQDRAVLHGLMQQVQCANMTVKRAAIAVVDRCLAASGGSGYLTANPLSRLYRDVRAGPFMQPFSALDAVEYIGQVKLGLGTALDS
jgi:alkylation response protein AidB-like acyl-CoA dehydrogenase